MEPHIPTPPPAPRQELKAQLHADSHFLMQRGVFDYSLLVAVARGRAGGAGVNLTPATFRQFLQFLPISPSFFPVLYFVLYYIFIYLALLPRSIALKLMMQRSGHCLK